MAQLTRSEENVEFVSGIREAAKASSVFVSVGIHEPPTTEQDAADKEHNNGRLRCYNTQLLISDQGQVLDKYRKVRSPSRPCRAVE